MSTTTTAHDTFSVEDLTGHLYYTIRYRLSGTTIWTQYNTSGNTFAISGLAINMIYDFQVVNVNGADNPASAISQGINITDPNPTINPTNVSVGYQFHNLSTDMTSYTSTIALTSSPGLIIATHVLSPGTWPDIVSDTFTSTFTTTTGSACAAPTAVSASLI